WLAVIWHGWAEGAPKADSLALPLHSYGKADRRVALVDQRASGGGERLESFRCGNSGNELEVVFLSFHAFRRIHLDQVHVMDQATVREQLGVVREHVVDFHAADGFKHLVRSVATNLVDGLEVGRYG